MAVVLDPNSDVEGLVVNWWNWRPTVALLFRAGVVTEDEAKRLNAGVGAAKVTAEQAVRMAETVEGILASLSRTEDRVLLDGTVTDAPPSDPSLPVDWDWYGAERPWLESFVAFCRRSEGFTPL